MSQSEKKSSYEMVVKTLYYTADFCHNYFIMFALGHTVVRVAMKDCMIVVITFSSRIMKKINGLSCIIFNF